MSSPVGRVCLETAGIIALSVSILFSLPASGGTVPVGFMSYDVISPGSSAQFDIVNLTGPNFSGDATWPIKTPLNLSSLSLVLSFSDGSMVTEPSSYFSLSSDGLSWDGTAFGIGGTNPLPTKASLKGDFSPTTITLFDGTKETIDSSFSATLLPSTPPTVADGDFVIIDATTTLMPVPEPSSLLLMMTGMIGLLLAMRKRLFGGINATASRVVMPLAFIACTLLIPSAHAQKQTLATAPSSGTVGTNVNVTEVTGWPPANTTASNIRVTWSATCGGAAIMTNTANSLKVIVPGTERVNVTIPASLSTGTYHVKLSDSAAGDTAFTSTNCSQVQVTGSSRILASCVPASSLGVIAPVKGPAPVKAIVPNGAWFFATPGIQVVQLETGGGMAISPVSIPTGTDAINSCAGNPATGESVCVANNAHVYHINASNTPTLLTSGSNATANFSGGSCNNCGVAINALTNQAVIAMGFNAPGSTALQTLDLSKNTFRTPFPLANHVSENVVVDPIQGGVLSLNESNTYDFISFDSSGNFTTEFGMKISGVGGEGDSSAVDCNTGIALGPYEFTNNLSLSDLKQATFTPGKPGSWTAPTSIPSLIGSFSAGLSGSAVAPGSSDLAVVTGEFGGSSFAVLQLPSTSGTGTPTLVDYAFVPCISGFSAGLDPHTLTAYVSPNDGKSHVVFASSPPPSQLVVGDMAAILGRSREADGHTVIGDSGPGTCLVPGDGVIRSLFTH